MSELAGAPADPSEELSMLALQEQLPTAMQAVGVLVEAMGIRPALEPRVSSGTLKTAFRGERISRKSFIEIAAALVDTVFPNSALKAEFGRADAVVDWKKALRDAGLQLLDSWDEARALVSAAAPLVSRLDHAVLPWARLAGIDLGVRWGCWMLARGAKLPSRAWLEAFVEGDGFAATIQDLRDEAGLTIEQLADNLGAREDGAAGIARETMEAWLYNGVLPHFDNLGRLSKALAKAWMTRRGGTSEADVERRLWMRLLWARAAGGLHRAIRESGGERGLVVARDLALGVALMARFVRSYVATKATPDATPFLWLHVATGVRGPWAAQIMATAAKNTDAPRNAWDLEHAAGPWSTVIARWYRELSEPREVLLAALQTEVAAADAAELLRVTEDQILAFPKVLKKTERNAALDTAIAAVDAAAEDEHSLETRAIEAQHRGDHRTAAACARRLVSVRPTNPKYHLWLGAALGGRGDIESGIQECRIADHLVDGGWLLAAAEVGILLLEAERPHDAVLAFEECSSRVHGERDAAVAVHVLYHHAEALLRTGRTPDAVQLLQRARALDRRHAPTAERLAHALLLNGEHKEGAAMAKEAAHLGRRDTLAAFERGEYRRSPSGAQQTS